MKTILNILLLGSVVLFVSCQEAPPVDAIYFGEKISEDGAKSVSEVMAMLKTQEEVTTKIKGNVESVCQAKGCWMNLTEGTADENGFFVKFQDYGFFVPKDLTGNVVVEGKAYMEITEVDELRHYAEDEGASEEEIAAITEPREEFKFMATGVKILK